MQPITSTVTFTLTDMESGEVTTTDTLPEWMSAGARGDLAYGASFTIAHQHREDCQHVWGICHYNTFKVAMIRHWH